MLATYQNGLFAVPENPVMRAVNAMPVMPSAGATLQPLTKGGMGCAVGIKPFGLGLVRDEGLRLYGDWYGSQQHGGMRLNGDPLPGLGSYWNVPRGARGGMGDLETMFSNFTTGDYGAALTGTDISSSLPNWLVIGGVVWLLFTLNSQQRRARQSVGDFADRVQKRRRIKAKHKAELAKA